jgi:hypothetical protein
MTLNLPKPSNPSAADDVAEGRKIASKATHWLLELDTVLAETDAATAPERVGNKSASR